MSCCMGSLAGVWSDHAIIIISGSAAGVAVWWILSSLARRSFVGGILSGFRFGFLLVGSRPRVYVFRWARFAVAVALVALWAGFACRSVFVSSGRFRWLACLPGIWPGLRSLLTSAGGLACMDRLINNYQTCLACHQFQIAACATISRKKISKKREPIREPSDFQTGYFSADFQNEKKWCTSRAPAHDDHSADMREEVFSSRVSA